MVAFQRYLTGQNNQKTIQVIANQTVVQANATARANVAKAAGESQAIQIITSQLKHDPQYLQWLAVNRWNGQMPYALGGGGTAINSSFGGFPFSNYQSCRHNNSSNHFYAHRSRHCNKTKQNNNQIESFLSSSC